jgi:hypothetical protein
MGFYSFITQDTHRSIANKYSGRKTFKVYMHDNKGNVYAEDNYEGYGDFGGVDFYELMASMNGMKDRNEAVNAWCANQRGLLYPNLTEFPDWEWRNELPENCEFQGYFYE